MHVVEAIGVFLIMLVVTSVKAYRRTSNALRTRSPFGAENLDVRWFVAFLVSAAHITWQTSLPVFNQFLEPLALPPSGASLGTAMLLDLSKHNLARNRFGPDPPPRSSSTHVLIMAVMELAQWLKHKSTNMKTVAKNLFYATALSAICTGALIWAIL